MFLTKGQWASDNMQLLIVILYIPSGKWNQQSGKEKNWYITEEIY